MEKKYLSMAVICGLLLSTSCIAAAEELADFGDENVVVTATRTEKRDVDVPASTEVITAQDIHESGAECVMDVLKMVNGIQFESMSAYNQNQGTMTNDVIIRGYGDSTLIMLNGKPISYRGLYDLSSIDAENIERVEVIKSGGSVLYGSEAIGGVINIITKTGDATNSVHIGGGNREAYQYGLNIGQENWRFSYNRKAMDKAHDVSTPAISSKAELRYFAKDLSRENANFSYAFNDNVDFMYNFSQSIGTHDRVITNILPGYSGANKAGVGDLYQTRRYTTTQHNFQLNYHEDDLKIGFFNNINFIESKGYTDKFKFEHKPYHTHERNNTYGIDIQNTWHQGEKSDITAGFNLKRESYSKNVTESTAKGVTYDRNNWALFGQLDQKVDDKNSFILGARETWTTGAYKGQNYSNFSASASWLHKMEDNNNLYATVAQSFKMPTFSQMYNSDDFAVPNPSLKPQHGINYEIGWKQDQEAHTWRVALFHMDVKDNISATWDKTDPVNPFYQYNNEDFRNTGLELGLSIDSGKPFSFDWGITWQNPESKSDNEKKLQNRGAWERTMGRLQLTSGISYKMNKFSSNLQAAYQCMRYSSESGPNREVKPYLLTSLNMIYQPDEHNEFNLELDNILSRRDRTSNSASDYFCTPATVMLNYTYKF